MNRAGFFAVALAALVLSADAPAQVPDGKTLILGMSGSWRAFHVLKGPSVLSDGVLEPRSTEVDTPLPPEDWRGADFDDSAWQRFRGRPFVPNRYGNACATADAGFAYLDGSSAFQSLMCLRGRFLCDDPAQVKNLSLTVEFRGGIVAYLNGREIARGHMPAGALDANALAEDYPADTFFGDDGKLLKMDWNTKDPKTIARWERIKRKLPSIVITPQLLRKGVNVLAIEVHRSAYPKEYDEAMQKNASYNAVPYLRSTCGITDLVLASKGAEGLSPNVAPPDGLQVWNSSPLVGANDFGDPLEPLRPVAIAACRNGAFSGEVSVGSNAPIKGLRAAASDLVEAKTRAVIPAAAVLVRYDGKAEAAPEIPAGVRPVMITVRVPKDAAGGDYAGTVTISVEGGDPVVVPVRLSVSAFTLPNPRDYETVVDIIQSPDTLALQYGAAPWSDAHWKLIDRSFEALGTAGLDTIYIPMIAETHFGNEQSMVRWIRKADGTYDHDFSVLEKYLDAYERHCGKPRIVCLYAWDLSLEGGSTWVNATMGKMDGETIKAREERAKLALGPEVTVIDAATGKTELLPLPQYSDAKSLALWKPLYDRLRAILAARGVLDRCRLGIPLDPKPTQGVVDLFKQLMPDTPWLVQDHIYVKAEKIGGVPVVYQANVFLTELATHDVAEDKFGAAHPELRLQFPRDLTADKAMIGFRLLTEMEMLSGLRGFARVGGDMWPALKDRRGRAHALPNRYPKSNAGGLSVWTWLLEPGPDGAIAPPRFEMLREGIQETEARIVVQRALRDGRLAGGLAQRARDMIARRNLATIVGLCGKINDPHVKQWWEHTAGYYTDGKEAGDLWYLSSSHDARTKELFDLAAEVQAVVPAAKP